MKIGSFEVHGIDCDTASRCRHYHQPVDIVAIQFFCCRRWYSCYDCHQALCDHVPQVWPAAYQEAQAILCGACARTLSIREYLADGTRCPHCQTAFNPGCRRHRHLYFAV